MRLSVASTTRGRVASLSRHQFSTRTPRRLAVSNGRRVVALFNFVKKLRTDSQSAGIYGSQGRDDYDRDDVEHYFNYTGMLAEEGTYDRLNQLLESGVEPVDLLLLMACAEGDKPKVEELLLAGARADIKVSYMHRVREKRIEESGCDTGLTESPSCSVEPGWVDCRGSCQERRSQGDVGQRSIQNVEKELCEYRRAVHFFNERTVFLKDRSGIAGSEGWMKPPVNPILPRALPCGDQLEKLRMSSLISSSQALSSAVLPSMSCGSYRRAYPSACALQHERVVDRRLVSFSHLDLVACTCTHQFLDFLPVPF